MGCDTKTGGSDRGKIRTEVLHEQVRAALDVFEKAAEVDDEDEVQMKSWHSLISDDFELLVQTSLQLISTVSAVGGSFRPLRHFPRAMARKAFSLSNRAVRPELQECERLRMRVKELAARHSTSNRNYLEELSTLRNRLRNEEVSSMRFDRQSQYFWDALEALPDDFRGLASDVLIEKLKCFVSQSHCDTLGELQITIRRLNTQIEQLELEKAESQVQIAEIRAANQELETRLRLISKKSDDFEKSHMINSGALARSRHYEEQYRLEHARNKALDQDNRELRVLLGGGEVKNLEEDLAKSRKKCAELQHHCNWFMKRSELGKDLSWSILDTADAKELLKESLPAFANRMAWAMNDTRIGDWLSKVYNKILVEFEQLTDTTQMESVRRAAVERRLQDLRKSFRQQKSQSLFFQNQASDRQSVISSAFDRQSTFKSDSTMSARRGTVAFARQGTGESFSTFGEDTAPPSRQVSGQSAKGEEPDTPKSGKFTKQSTFREEDTAASRKASKQSTSGEAERALLSQASKQSINGDPDTPRTPKISKQSTFRLREDDTAASAKASKQSTSAEVDKALLRKASTRSIVEDKGSLILERRSIHGGRKSKYDTSGSVESRKSKFNTGGTETSHKSRNSSRYSTAEASEDTEEEEDHFVEDVVQSSAAFRFLMDHVGTGRKTKDLEEAGGNEQTAAPAETGCQENGVNADPEDVELDNMAAMTLKSLISDHVLLERKHCIAMAQFAELQKVAGRNQHELVETKKALELATNSLLHPRKVGHLQGQLRHMRHEYQAVAKSNEVLKSSLEVMKKKVVELETLNGKAETAISEQIDQLVASCNRKVFNRLYEDALRREHRVAAFIEDLRITKSATQQLVHSLSAPCRLTELCCIEDMVLENAHDLARLKATPIFEEPILLSPEFPGKSKHGPLRASVQFSELSGLSGFTSDANLKGRIEEKERATEHDAGEVVERVGSLVVRKPAVQSSQRVTPTPLSQRSTALSSPMVALSARTTPGPGSRSASPMESTVPGRPHSARAPRSMQKRQAESQAPARPKSASSYAKPMASEVSLPRSRPRSAGCMARPKRRPSGGLHVTQHAAPAGPTVAAAVDALNQAMQKAS